MAEEALQSGVLEVAMVDDNRSGEVVIFHRPSRVLLISDLLYKSDVRACPAHTRRRRAAPLPASTAGPWRVDSIPTSGGSP